MPYLKSLPDDATLLNVFKSFPETAAPLLDFHESLLRGPSPLSVAERELLAAFVSRLNACTYCSGVHEATAQAFEVEPEVLRALMEDIETSPVDTRLKPIFHYVRKLTESPSRIVPADAAAVFAAGWDDAALHDAVNICALFNFMNRMVEGLGIKGTPEQHQMSGQRLSQIGYAGLKDLFS
jgi:uncharacterized peroxidase-related enzyme